MEMGKYNYLKDYKAENYGSRIEWPSNVFYSLSEDEIITAEKSLKFKFPSEIRQFYKEMGYGRLVVPHVKPSDYKFYSANEILPPHIIENFLKGILNNASENYYMSEPAFELLEPGDLPFFEMYDSSYFLVMRPYSENPNAIWFMDVKIEDSFEKFIWRLYYKSPTFYSDIIEADNQAKDNAR